MNYFRLSLVDFVCVVSFDTGLQNPYVFKPNVSHQAEFAQQCTHSICI